MEERDDLGLQSLGICNRLYNFIVRTLTSHALKTVTLGHASPAATSGVMKRGASSRCDLAVHPMAQEISVEGENLEAMVEQEQDKTMFGYSDNDHNRDVDSRCVSCVPFTEEEKPEEPPRRPAPGVASKGRGPKKMVSINETVEEIKMSRGNKRKKSFEKFPSLESEIDELKPLKSILKIGSNVNGGTLS